MAGKLKIIDADFEVVSGPLRVGDEHPIRKGWYLTDKLGKRGEPLWYQPPSPASKWVRRIALILFGLMMAAGILGALMEPPTEDNPHWLPEETRADS